MIAVFDTNLLIDYLNGVPEAAALLESYENPAISRVTWMETLAGALGKPSESVVRGFLGRFHALEIDVRVAEEAVLLRQKRKLRLPDAIILASARVNGWMLLTRNTRDFDPRWPEIREPYRL